MNTVCEIARTAGGWFCLVLWATFPCARAEELVPLHKQIDDQITLRLVQAGITPAEKSSDAEFVRRVYLDLNGVIPTAEQARSFLEDTSDGKRSRLIDHLLTQPEYALHMARVWDVMLTERRVPTISSYDVPAAEWRRYLTESFAENKPWDQLVREILGSDGTDLNRTAAVKFYLVRDVAAHQLTRDVGRLFLGIDLQCAQCHDDPRFEYRQADYFGIYAFLQRMKLHALTPRGAAVGESAEGKTTFTSVFTAQSGETDPRLPGGEMLADPAIEKGMEYVVAPGPKERSVPTYSRRLKLAEQLPRHETRGFARNLVNRLWALLMGRGIVHPLDLHHAANPPSHPELLDLLESWTIAHQYDIKALLREIALSETYQRSSVLPQGGQDVSADVFAEAPLRGLTAEQFRWSWLQATGRIKAHDARLDAAKKSSAAAAPAELAWKTRFADNVALERQTNELLLAFASLPGNVEGAFQPVVDQALFLRNSAKLLPLLHDDSDTLLARLAVMPDVALLAEELYLSVLARKPTSEEAEQVRQFVSGKTTPAERREPLQALVWGLLLSAEFRLNH